MKRRCQLLFASHRVGGALLLGFLVFLALAEQGALSLALTLLIGAGIAGLVFTLTRRPRFSILVAMVLLTASALLSAAKYKFMALKLHAFDAWLYIFGSDTITYLLDQFPLLTLTAVACTIALVALLTTAFRWDTPIPDQRLNAGLTTALALVLMPVVAPSDAGTYRYTIGKDHFASAFFVSLLDIGKLLGTPPIAQHLTQAAMAAPFLRGPGCDGGTPPDIVLVLSESAVPPAQVPGMKHDPSIMPYFESFDGKVHKAGVETHGGGTWISEASVMSGLSMADFGWMRPYPTMLLRDKLKTGFPATLAACGYATAMIMPTSYRFANNGPMMTAMGIADYRDRFALQAPTQHEPDSFYYDHALAYIDAHHAKSDKPLFLYIESIEAHAPYEDRFEPQRIARGEPFGNEPLMEEYVRRLTFAQEDYARLIEALRQRGRPVLVVQFGDHQPYLTGPMYFKNPADEADFASPAYQTFYAMTPVGFVPAAPLPDVPVLDLAYLGATIMDVAGLPLDPSNLAKLDLRDRCAGRFHTCKMRGQVDSYLSRLYTSGLIR